METNPHLLVLGDSLSDGGRLQDPGGIGSAWPAAAIRLSREMELPPFRWTNRAVGGSRSVEVLESWQAGDFAPPDRMVVLVGANDLWRHHVPWLDHTPVSPQAFGQNLSRLLYAALEAGTPVLDVCTPTSLHKDPEHPWNAALEDYRGWCREVADACGANLIPTGEEWMESLRILPDIRWTYDGVHPRPVGHERLARTWLHHALGAPALPCGELPDRPSDLRLGSWP